MKTAIRRVPLALALALAVPIALTPGGAFAAATYKKESLQAFEEQLRGGQIAQATINKRVRSIRITLKDGSHVLAKYHAGEEPKVRRELAAKHVHVAVLTPEQAKKEQAKHPVHHKLRYIAGGVVIAVVVIAGGVVLYRRRRQQSEI